MSSGSSVRTFPNIKAVRSYVIGGVGSGMAQQPVNGHSHCISANVIIGGDYHNVKGGHWYASLFGPSQCGHDY